MRTAWLIEMKLGGSPIWYTKESCGPLGNWTTDAYRALSFASNRKARSYRDLSGLFNAEVTEHGFDEPAPVLLPLSAEELDELERDELERDGVDRLRAGDFERLVAQARRVFGLEAWVARAVDAMQESRGSLRMVEGQGVAAGDRVKGLSALIEAKP
jgi:hypothetical protein